MNTSVLTKNQKKTYGPKIYTENGTTYKLTVTVRYDDDCGNGHNSFDITGMQYRKAANGRWTEGGWCTHGEISKHFPELAPYIKWHGTSSAGPMYYLANTLHHVLEHGPTRAWVYFSGPQDPLKIEKEKKRLLGYEKADTARAAENTPGYRVVWDKTTAKVRNLDYARYSAVWPEALDEELTAPGLKQRLKDRLPKLMDEFKTAMEHLGFVY